MTENWPERCHRCQDPSRSGFSAARAKCKSSRSFRYRTCAGAILFVTLVTVASLATTAQAQNTSSAPSTVEPERRCGNETRTCKRGVLLPVWPPAEVDQISTLEKVGRAAVYFVCLFYLFLGVSIIADRFMASIEVITSKEKEIKITKPSGEVIVTSVRIWNETVSNLTLMALGSSAPEIMLSVIEVMGKGFRAGELGPSTIVGSASFNLFIIIAICMYVIPDGEIRKVKHPRVFFVTAVWSIMAYIWLYLILAVFSRGIVEVWEGVITFLFFPVLVVLAWIADRRLLVYKYMYKRYRKKKHMIVETEGSAGGELRDMVHAEEMRHLGGKGSNAGTLNRSLDTLDGNISIDLDDDGTWDTEAHKREIIRLLRELKKKHPDADMQELARMANIEALNHQHKSRAFYRIQATRRMTGAGNILKVKSDNLTKDLTESLQTVAATDEDLISKISFDPCEYKVMENCGNAEIQVVRRGGDLNTTLYVDYRTEDGTANAGSDYEFSEGTVIFRPGETLHMLKIPIIDDDIFEEDEYFRVKLNNVRIVTSDGTSEPHTHTTRLARLEAPAVATVVILDDDHAGVFTFPDPSITVSESVGVLSIPVKRDSGARGCVVIPYKTVPFTASGGGEDYIDAFGELEFANDETINYIKIGICDTTKYYKRAKFFLELGDPYVPSSLGNDTGSDSGINGREEEEEKKPVMNGKISEEEEEAKRIAELGKPRLGDNKKIEIVIEESYEFKNTVDKLIKKANLAVIVGTSSWREQFSDALSVKGGDDDEEDDEGGQEAPTAFDYVMHFLTVFWKLLFAIVPPTDYFGGWACFACSIMVIGLLTAVIGDIASHFGCTIDLNDAVTAVTLVAMGTSVPDTFASKVAAVGDQYADASIGNVTGSNAVNVFLGIGVAWTIAAVYWAIMGETPEEKIFRVQPGNLAFSVTVFSLLAICAIIILMVRRKYSKIGGELGGPRKYKIISSMIFVSFWLLYIVLAALDSYCIISTF